MAKNRKRNNSSTVATKVDNSNYDIKSQTPNANVPQILLIELSSLSTLKYKIGLKSKSFSLNLPVNTVDKESILLTQSNDFGENNNKYSSDFITLNCRINNAKLPLVPPIKVLVPYDYPNNNAFVECIQLDEFDEDMLPEYSNYSFLSIAISLCIHNSYFKR
jgi:hypothetical protein